MGEGGAHPPAPPPSPIRDLLQAVVWVVDGAHVLGRRLRRQSAPQGALSRVLDLGARVKDGPRSRAVATAILDPVPEARWGRQA